MTGAPAMAAGCEDPTQQQHNQYISPLQH